MGRPRVILVVLCAAVLLLGAVGLVTRDSRKSQDPNRMCEAAVAGDLEQIHLAARSGANLNAPDDCGFAPLWRAVTCRQTEVAAALLACGADPGWTTPSGWSLLHVAAVLGDGAMVELLLEHGADPDARTFNGYTPLHVACLWRYPQVEALLVEYGADIEAQTDRGWTPLHLAAGHGALAAAECLLRGGARVSPVDEDGNTPIDLARANDWPEVVSFLARENAGG